MLTTPFNMSLASLMYFWMSLLSQTSRVRPARPSSTCRRKDVRRSSPGGDRVGHRATSLGSSGPGPCPQWQLLSLAGGDCGGPMVGVQGGDLGGAEEGLVLPSGQALAVPIARWGELGSPCLLGCAEGPCSHMCARFFGRAEPRCLCRLGPALPLCASSRRHVRFGESLLAASHSACSSPLCWSSARRCPGHLLAGQPLCPVSARLGNRHLLSKGPHW